MNCRISGIKRSPDSDLVRMSSSSTLLRQLPTHMKLFKTKSAIPRNHELGGKASSLQTLASAGLPVPAFTVVTIHDFLRHLADHRLEKAWRKHFSDKGPWFTEQVWKQRLAKCGLCPALLTKLRTFVDAHPGYAFAVRSSCSREDGADLSFAGQYDTFLNRHALADIVDSLYSCWASLFNERVQSYLRKHDAAGPAPAMAVIVQVMINAAQSGVSFSVDPRTGKDTHVVTEAVRGLGEGLVSGVVAPDYYVVEWRAQSVVEQRLAKCNTKLVPIERSPFVERRLVTGSEISDPVLDSAMLHETTEFCVQVQALLGFPVDIEWSRDEQGHFWLLQARPITSINMTCADQQWTTADFRDGGVSSDVCTPLMWSLYDYVWEQAMPAYLCKVKLLPPYRPAAWGAMFFGRPYWNVGCVKAALAMLPGYVESKFDDDLGIAKNYSDQGQTTRLSLRNLWHAIQVLFALERSFSSQLRYCKQFLPRQQERLTVLDNTPDSLVDTPQFPAFYEELVTTGYYQSEGSYFTHIFNTSNLSTLFREQLQKNAPQVDFASLVAALDDVAHLRQNSDMWETISIIRHHQFQNYWLTTPLSELLKAYRQGATDNGMQWVREHILEFKHHSSRELDLLVPRIDEDPTIVFESIKQRSRRYLEKPRDDYRSTGIRALATRNASRASVRKSAGHRMGHRCRRENMAYPVPPHHDDRQGTGDCF